MAMKGGNSSCNVKIGYVCHNFVSRQADLEETIARLRVQLEQEREEKKDIISEKTLLHQQAQQVL